MSGYIEVEVVGDHKAYIEAGSIVGVIHSQGLGRDDPATPDFPLTVILRGGDSLENVYGISPAMLILYATGCRWALRFNKRKFGMLLAIDARGDFENTLMTLQQQMELEHGRAP